MDTIVLNAGNVKAAMSGTKSTSLDLWQVPIEKIRVIEGFNVRAKDAGHREHIANLAASIVANGFYQSKPLAGYVALEGSKQIIYVTDGHCRLEAAQAAIEAGAELATLPVVISPKGTSLEDLTVSLVTNNTGKPLTPYEVGTVCKRLTEFGWDEKQIGQKLNMTPRVVGDLLSLLGAPKAIRNLVAASTVSATLAMEAIKKHGDKAVDKLEAGVVKATASGKKKATKKHVEDAKPSPRAVLKALIAWDAKSAGDHDKELKDVIKQAKEALS